MKIKNNWLDEAALLCGELSSDDGLDPRLWNKRLSRKVDNRKSSQLCSEVRRVLSLVLANELKDPLLMAVRIVEVSPESTKQQLSIGVKVDEQCSDVREDQVMKSLAGIQGYLRSIIAESVHRKRVPALNFHYVGKQGVRE